MDSEKEFGMKTVEHKLRGSGDHSRYQVQSLPERRNLSVLAGTGAALLTMAAYVQYRTKKAERESPPIGKFLEVDGVRLHYIERGRGKPVVLLHGNGTMAQELETSGLIDLAAAHYRVIAFDRPGYGYSERPGRMKWDATAQAKLLHSALRQLGVEDPIIVGHSWGTLVAIAMGLAYPDYAQSLVLLSGYYYPTPRLDVPLFSTPAIPVLGDAMRHTISPILGRLLWPAMIKKLFAPAETAKRFQMEYPVWMSLRPSQLRATTEEIAMMIPCAHRLSSQYGRLRLPIVIMSGASDLHVLPALHSRKLHEELPQSTLILVPDVGHMITHSATEQVLSAIVLADETSSMPPSRQGMNASSLVHRD
jgi:pimeloyl-ACP methyl ester carboxylesterase